MNEDTSAHTRTPPASHIETPAAGQAGVSVANTAAPARSGLALGLALAACALAGWASWQAWDTRARTLDLRAELAQRLTEGTRVDRIGHGGQLPRAPTVKS